VVALTGRVARWTRLACIALDPERGPDENKHNAHRACRRSDQAQREYDVHGPLPRGMPPNHLILSGHHLASVSRRQRASQSTSVRHAKATQSTGVVLVAILGGARTSPYLRR
jgi:hypothetical protein